MKRRLLTAALVAGTLAGAFACAFSVRTANAHYYCDWCVDVCMDQPEGGCVSYTARPNVLAVYRCAYGLDVPYNCSVVEQVTCFTTYTECSTGYCDVDSCLNASGCSTYTFNNINAGTNYTGPLYCN